MLMPVLALVLYVLGLQWAFGWRTLQQWRRTGRTGWARVPAAPAAARWGTAAFGAALVFGLAGLVLAGDRGVPATEPPGWLAGFGIAAAAGGLVLVLVSQAAMGQSWRIGVDPAERTALVTTGVFGWVRNPVLTGMVVFQAGIALMVPSPVTLAAVVLLLVAVQVQVRAVEEPYLVRVHGAAYARYAAAAGRFLPGVGRLRRDRAGQ